MNEKIKRNAISLAIGLSAVFLSAGSLAVDLKIVDSEKEALLTKDIITLFTDGTGVPAHVESIRQLGNSDNYLFKYQEGESYYTMMYIEDIKSIMIQSTGEIFSLKDKKFLTQEFNAEFTKSFIKQLDVKESITFEGLDPLSSEDIYVFTDPTCGYCQKLHREISDYQDQNINVHYFPFPRGGLQGYGYEQLVNIECSIDKKNAMYEAKISQSMPKVDPKLSSEEIQECRNIVKKYYELGSKMGVKGTPAIFSIDGNQLGGYVPAQQIKYMLKK